MVLEYEAQFMELLRYDPHLNMEKLKVNKFKFNINFNIHVKARILMPQKLHDAVQKALIVEEEMNNGGQRRTRVRPIGHMILGAQKHQTLARHTSRYQDTSRGPMLMKPRRPNPQQRTPYRGPLHQQQRRPKQQYFRYVQWNRPGSQAGRPTTSTLGTRSTGMKAGCWTCGEPHYQ
jgi:hypothetical protein